MAKRVQRLVAHFTVELGGLDRVGGVQMVRIRRAAELVVAAELKRASLLRGEPVDTLALGQLEGHADRALRRLGLPAPKPVEPPGPWGGLLSLAPVPERREHTKRPSVAPSVRANATAAGRVAARRKERTGEPVAGAVGTVPGGRSPA
jgi:hypothetical protein